MSDEVKKLAPAIWSEIQKAQRILLHCHPSPDGDSIGSGLAMFNLLKSIGKNPTLISGDSKIPESYDCLPGFDEITRASYDQLDIGEFDLFIIQDVTDFNRVTSKTNIIFPSKLRTVTIDHHPHGNIQADVSLIEPSYQATCELLFELMSLWPVHITPDIAANLYVGIYSDSVSFMFANPNILTYCGQLLNINPHITKIIYSLENSRKPNNIHFLGISLSNISVYFGGKVAMSVVENSELAKRGIVKSETENMRSFTAWLMSSVKDWFITICICEEFPGELVVSLRSRDPHKYNVSTIARQTGNGGGHPAASGLKLKDNPQQLRDKLLGIISNLYPDLGRP